MLASLGGPWPDHLLMEWCQVMNFYISSLLCLLGNSLFPFVCINPPGLGSHCMIQQVVIVTVVVDFDVQVAPGYASGSP